MSKVIAFKNGSELSALNKNDDISYKIQPFIQEILDNLVVGDILEKAITKAAKKHQQLAESYFEYGANNIAESFSLKDEFLFLNHNPITSFSYQNKQRLLSKVGQEIIENESILPDIHNLLYLCGQSNLTYKQICQQISSYAIDLLDKLIKYKIVGEQEPSRKSIPQKKPGIFRLQHATLLYRTKTTGILVDPHLHSNYGISNIKNDITRAQLEGSVDAILISHSHYDHWHYPTLMMFSPEIPIFVPKVPRGSIICEDMEARLKILGFKNVTCVDWNADPIMVGDIEINILPFYGEQPLVPEYNQPKHPNLRNWGNTYLLRTEYYTSWFLIDAGQDPMGSMFDVAEYVKQKFGKVDYIVSNFQPLSYNSIGANLSSWGIDILGNLLSNPQILSVTNKPEGEHLATLGPTGVAEICKIVEAKSCLPYADSWAEIGQPGVNDEKLIPAVAIELKNLGCLSQVVPWKIGDGYVVNGKAEILAGALA
ncbi:MBL fold metallo-hydrolase [Cylindrospermum sp. FACHB-282]|uniref:MBL fold metallo-hydrolase n=1 Tax=Cylindrospermum sp. FACHB-282 TaxID=2692794 RepID=UPI0016849C7F|nr:MBL fold metallo-hydrolase [Cylindrospermum sp. FACHB-282]MBD2387080.1 MBL fold metallo-hydrolase [Cylindrospermum sp. FACHB-282]